MPNRATYQSQAIHSLLSRGQLPYPKRTDSSVIIQEMIKKVAIKKKQRVASLPWSKCIREAYLPGIGNRLSLPLLLIRETCLDRLRNLEVRNLLELSIIRSSKKSESNLIMKRVNLKGRRVKQRKIKSVLRLHRNLGKSKKLGSIA